MCNRGSKADPFPIVAILLVMPNYVSDYFWLINRASLHLEGNVRHEFVVGDRIYWNYDLVGVFMMQSVPELDLKDFGKAVPAVVTMLAMPLTFSIAEGIALGFVVYVLFSLGTGRAKEVKPLAWVLGALFLAHLIWK